MSSTYISYGLPLIYMLGPSPIVDFLSYYPGPGISLALLDTNSYLGVLLIATDFTLSFTMESLGLYAPGPGLNVSNVVSDLFPMVYCGPPLPNLVGESYYPGPGNVFASLCTKSSLVVFPPILQDITLSLLADEDGSYYPGPGTSYYVKSYSLPLIVNYFVLL